MGEGSYPPVSPVAAGIRCRCPRCGRGRLFEGYLTVREHCSECGLELRKADTGDGPAVFIIFIIGFAVVAAALFTEAAWSPPYWVHVVLWLPAILIGSFGLLRPAKALVVALQYRHGVTQDIG